MPQTSPMNWNIISVSMISIITMMATKMSMKMSLNMKSKSKLCKKSNPWTW